MTTTLLPPSLLRARDLVTPALQLAVADLGPGVRDVAGYHFGWLDADGRPSDAGGGKALRPALALLSAQAAGAPAGTGISGAVAVELVHNFSLLHDDLMDGDSQRRHRATAWTVFGAADAILAGDALMTAAQQVLLDARLPGALDAARRLAVTTQRLITGQKQDLAFESRTDVRLTECLDMAAGKTGALLGCSAAIGAELAGAPGTLVDGLAAYGEHVGLAFQLVDDLLGIWGDPQTTGKPVLSDLRSRKKSLPVVAALESGGRTALRLAQLLAEDALSETELAEAAELVEAGGGRDWAAAEADRQLAAAMARVDALTLPAEPAEELRRLAEFTVRRTL